MQDTQQSPGLTIPDEDRPAALIRYAIRTGVPQLVAAATLLVDHRSGMMLRDGSLDPFLTQTATDDGDVLTCDWTGLFDSLSLREPMAGQDPQDWVVLILACGLAVDRAVHRLGWLLGQIDAATFRAVTRALHVAAYRGVQAPPDWPDTPMSSGLPVFDEVSTRFPGAGGPPE